MNRNECEQLSLVSNITELGFWEVTASMVPHLSPISLIIERSGESCALIEYQSQQMIADVMQRYNKARAKARAEGREKEWLAHHRKLGEWYTRYHQRYLNRSD
jgi:hypothetical protein